MTKKMGLYGLLIGAVLIAYHNAFSAAFQFDDYNVIVDNPAVRSFSAWFSDLPRGIRPLLKFTYTTNWLLGPGVFGFHLFNIAVHAGNTVLICLLSRRFFERLPSTSQYGEFAAIMAALMFALHPVQTEAVTYVSGRSMSLMAVFYLGSMLAYARGVESGRKILLYLASPALFVAAFFVKETAMTLPFALVAWEASNERLPAWKTVAGRQAVHWALFFGLALFLAIRAPYSGLLAYGFGERGPVVNILSQINGLSYLLSSMVMIHRLNIDPGLPVISSWDPLLIGQFSLLVLLAFCSLLALRKRAWIGFGLAWFFLHLLPTNSIIPRLDIANERHVYLASWGIFLALCGEVAYWRGTGVLKAKTATAAVLSVLVVLGFFTIKRNNVYQSETSLWEDSVRTAPDNARAHNNLGFAYSRTGRGSEALREYQEALRLRPGYELAKDNLNALTQRLDTKRTPLSEKQE